MLVKVFGSAVFGVEATTVDTRQEFYKILDFPEFDFSDVKGQESIKRCMEIASAGGHNIIQIGNDYILSTILCFVEN